MTLSAKTICVFLLLFLSLGKASHSQTLTQTVRGKIVDQESLSALPGANVIVLESNNSLGSTTDADGNFRIDNVPVGRISLAITFIGYEDKVLPNILVTS
ncbi:MAG TPA: carboxypeptidase-like regulatory domain-containing protein, partial [Chryseolinea sp.]|nr:carboxypeptidase-like regulatory domain-containing protein [Chryseolinea sp.]